MNTATEIYLWTAFILNTLGLLFRLGFLGYGEYPRTSKYSRGEDSIWILVTIGFIIWIAVCFDWIG